MLNFQLNMRILYAAHNRKSFIFSDYNKKAIFSPENFATVYIKYYIWCSRCKKTDLNLNSFMIWFKNELRILKAAFNNDKNISFITELTDN